MRIKGQKVGDSQFEDFFEHISAVQGFTPGTAVLAALVQEGHDDVDAQGLAGGGQNDALEILIVVIRTHALFKAKHLVSAAVVQGVTDQVEVMAAHSALNDRLAFAGRETHQIKGNAVIVAEKAGIHILFCNHVEVFTTALQQEVIDFLAEIDGSGEGENAHRSKGRHGIGAVLVIGVIGFIFFFKGKILFHTAVSFI